MCCLFSSHFQITEKFRGPLAWCISPQMTNFISYSVPKRSAVFLIFCIIHWLYLCGFIIQLIVWKWSFIIIGVIVQSFQILCWVFSAHQISLNRLTVSWTTVVLCYKYNCDTNWSWVIKIDVFSLSCDTVGRIKHDNYAEKWQMLCNWEWKCSAFNVISFCQD